MLPARGKDAPDNFILGKGRVERLFGTFQDRLISELRRARARTLREANTILARFLPRHNARFTRPPADPHSAYRPLAADQDPDDICGFAYERTVANDNTVRLGERLLQILPGPHRQSYAKAKVIVREHLDGTLIVAYRGERLRSQPIRILSAPGPVQLRARKSGRLTGVARGQATTKPRRPTVHHRQATQSKGPSRPHREHPWNRAVREEFRRKRLKQAGVTFSLNA